MNTLGHIVDAIMDLNLEEQSLLMQLLESRQKTLMLPRDIQAIASEELFEDGKLSAGGIQGIMDELSATLDNTSHLSL